ncbi:sister chromatid cohesion protein 1 [Elasticomyces elasticus]|nr:sister chromatid cohesion protein 1 [Elasticomyces elasticus]
MERSKQQAEAAKTTSRSGRRANLQSTSSKRSSILPFPHPGRTREAKEHTASRTSYAHGVYSVRCGIREISHAVKRESRERKQALQKLDEAQRVALYLQKKLESLEETIGDLSQGQDVKVGMKDYDEALEELSKTVLQEASLQHANVQRKTTSATKRKRQEDDQPEIVPAAKRQQQSSTEQRARSISTVQCQDDDQDMREPVPEAPPDYHSRRQARPATSTATPCLALASTPLLPRPDRQPQEQPVQLLATPAHTPEVSVVPHPAIGYLLRVVWLSYLQANNDELRNVDLKLQMERVSDITRQHTSLPKNKTLLNLLQHRQKRGFVGDIMRNDRMQDWAPELRKIFAFGERDPFGPLAKDPRSTVSRESKKTLQSIGPNACLYSKEKPAPSRMDRTPPRTDVIMIDDEPDCEASRPRSTTSQDNAIVTKDVRKREMRMLDVEMTVDALGLELGDDASSGLSSPDGCGPVTIDDGLTPAAVSLAEDMQMREAAEALAGLGNLDFARPSSALVCYDSPYH